MRAIQTQISTIITLLFLLLPTPQLHSAEIPESGELYQGIGLDPERTIYSSEPTEAIDPFTGSLVLNYTDLHLPGNGGLDLAIQRTYYSKNFSWRIFFGKIERKDDLVTIELQDGSVHYGYAVDGSNNTQFLTKDFGKITFPAQPTESNPPTMRTSDGVLYTFKDQANPNQLDYYLLSSIEKYTSRISIHYKSAQDLTGLPTSGLIPDYVVDSVGRIVRFTHQLSGGIAIDPKTISYCPNFSGTCSEAARIKIEYRYGSYPDSLPRLVEVKPPTGPSWHYDYQLTEAAYRLTTVISPAGGITKYGWGHFDKAIDSLSFRRFIGLTQKTESGRGVPSNVKTFAYTMGEEGDDYDYTTITNSTGRTTRIKYFGYKKKYNTGDENCWQVGLTKEVETKNGGGILEQTVSTEWEKSTISFSSVRHKIAGLCSDSRTYIPRTTRTTTSRDGQIYSTSYETFDLYNNPTKIFETGDAERETTIGYWYEPSLNIVKNKPDTSTVTSTAFAGTSQTVNSYNSKGQILKVDDNGVITENEYLSNGNISTTKDGNGNRVYYQWTLGRVSEIKNDEYPANPVVRTINPDGTIQKVTSSRGNTTEFSYDLLGRLTKIKPPSTSTAPSGPTTVDYPVTWYTYSGKEYLANTGKTVRRLGKFTESTIDGRGRPTVAKDDLGVTSTTIYLADGLKDYSDSSIGDKTTFDSLGRPVSVLHKDNTSIRFNYNKSNTLITDETNKTTSQEYKAFGDPDGKTLTAIVDADGKRAEYDYNIAGLLTRTTFDGAVLGNFGYNGNFYLTSESHPETGVVTYGRDAVGNLKSLTDGMGTKNYSYDKLDRLKTIQHGSDTISFTYDRDGNVTSRVGANIQTGITYDAVNRTTALNETILGRSFQTQFAYDAGDNLRAMTYPFGREVLFLYNSHSQLIAIPGFADDIDYMPGGQTSTGLIKSVSHSNNILLGYDYTPRNFVKTIDARIKNSASAVTCTGYGYGDARGNLTDIRDNCHTASTRSLNYDALNRVKSFAGSWGNGSYSYAADGNRTAATEGASPQLYSYSSNRLASINSGAVSFAYNGDGDVTRIERGENVHNLRYDGFHNNIGVDLNNKPLLTSRYNTSGQRIVKHNEKTGKGIVSHYDLTGNVISESDEKGRLVSDYVYFHGKLLARVMNTANSAAASGDVNCDGTVNLRDIITILKIASGSSENLCSLALENGDFNGNRSIGLEDGPDLLRFLAE